MLVALLLLAACTPKRSSLPEGEAPAALPPAVNALLEAYPGQVIAYDGGFLVLSGGDSLLFASEKELSHEERLACKDIAGMFHDVYPLGPLTVPAFQSDPGRYRNEELFKAMYGRSEAEVRTRLEPVSCFGTNVPFTRVNGAADSLRAVIREVGEEHPHLQKYFSQPSSFYWRNVRGADRLSAHSFGIAIDIGVKYSNYWRWSNPGKGEDDALQYENRFPEELIRIFEKHGFISGARWYHFDTRHVEFRPELIRYSLSAKRAHVRGT